jgi:DNA-binding beta-propeller fold protein YncE
VVRGTEDFAGFNQPLGIAIDTVHGEIYVANSGYGRIDVYTFAGGIKAQLPHSVKAADGSQVPGVPAALALDGRGRVFVVDAKDHGVDVLDFRGRTIGRLDISPGSGPEPWPTAVAVVPDGRVLVSTGGDSGRVYVFTPALEPAGSWGEPGAGPGHLSSITAMSATADGQLVITRSDDDPIVQVFTPEGRYVRGFGFLANGPGNFAFPTGVAVTRDGRIWVCDQIRQCLEVFDSTGTYLAALGSPGRRAGELNYPYSLATDGDGRLAITERMGARMQIWSVK